VDIWVMSRAASDRLFGRRVLRNRPWGDVLSAKEPQPRRPRLQFPPVPVGGLVRRRAGM